VTDFCHLKEAVRSATVRVPVVILRVTGRAGGRRGARQFISGRQTEITVFTTDTLSRGSSRNYQSKENIMKTLVLAAAVGLVAFAPSLVPGSTAQTAQAQSKQQQAVAGCVKRIGASAKILRVSPKFVTRQRATQTCQQNRARPVLSTAIVLRNYVKAAKIGARKASPQIVKACPGMVRKAVLASGAGAKAASADNVKRACANAKGRPILATAGFLSRMTAGAACMDRVMASMRGLRFGPKVANPKSVGAACRGAKNRPAIAARNMLTRITKGAK
jgi:hypothetical protein